MLTKAEIQRLRSLRDKREREALGRFVIEGEKVVAELLAENFLFEEIYATAAWPERSDRGDRVSDAENAGLAAPGSSAQTGGAKATSLVRSEAKVTRISD